ncbi:MAG: galactokinase [Actinobacteria bacterium]|nr:galactokinase [Actinomycetota bacterium]
MSDGLPARLEQVAPPDGLAWRAPGRANLIGEHTDYNEGFVLPIALDMATYVAGRRVGGVLELRSLDLAGDVAVDVATGEGPAEGWGAYATGVVRALLDDGVAVEGFSGVVASDVPRGAGLSSSAALEVAIAGAVAGESLDPVRMAKICQRAENVYVGMQCGIMDQLASSAGREGAALLIDCRDNTIEPVEMPEGTVVLLVDSGVAHQHVDGAYNDRRRQCEEAASALGAPSLRDVDLERLERGKTDMSEVAYRRARHVVSENDRVLTAVEALRTADTATLSELFSESHRSYSQDFEASTPEVDELVGIAGKVGGVVASRLTGGGFGGCTVNLVEAEIADQAAAEVVSRYEKATGRAARWWVSAAAAGARPVDY